MIVKDDEQWRQQSADLLNDGDQGERFLAFLLDWCDRAESAMETDDLDAADAMRFSLLLTENIHGRQTIGMVGQLLAVAVMHWTHADALTEGLTEIELRLVQDIVAVKIGQLQSQAAQNA